MNWDLKTKIVEIFGTQADFAQAVKVDETIVSRIVRGRRQLDLKQQNQWARALNSDPEELFGRDNGKGR